MMHSRTDGYATCRWRRCLHTSQPDKRGHTSIWVGVKCPIVADVDGEVFGYRGNSLLADWWYWTHEIAKYQEILNKNGKKTSKKLRKLYRKRQRRFGDAINKMVKDLVEKCWRKGVSEIICGDLVRIREGADFGRKGNVMSTTTGRMGTSCGG